jgi:hypothetical protein
MSKTRGSVAGHRHVLLAGYPVEKHRIGDADAWVWLPVRPASGNVLIEMTW